MRKEQNLQTTETQALNIPVVSNSVYSITDEQVAELIEKVGVKIYKMLMTEGKSSKTLALTNSVKDTIKTYLSKHCC